jgi:sterol desaturase/sphingolipid hydroxylase (fatty acid hydroxylase superfamily)
MNQWYYPQSGMLSSVLLFISGVFVWTFFEYLLHRYLFHLRGYSEFIKRFTYTLHGIHHEFPRSERWVFMPPLPGTLFILVFYGLFWILLRDYTFIFLAGFLNGYLIYVGIHYLIHLKKPINGFKFLWRHHALHHHKYPDKAFGVSSTFWDHVFHTMPPEYSNTKTLQHGQQVKLRIVH